MKSNEPSPKRSSRRRFLGAAAGSAVLPALAETPLATGSPAPLQLEAPTPRPIDVPLLRTAQAVNGMAQTDEALGKAVTLVNRYRSAVEGLRATPVATSVEPAFSFDPRRGRKLRMSAPRPAAARSHASTSLPFPANADDVAFAPAHALRTWLDAGKISSEDLAKACLDRLTRFDATLACVVTLADERALVEARRADTERRSRGHRIGALHGIPYGAKDIIDTARIRTTWGARPYLNRAVPERDATAIARLTDAGSVLVAKLSTGELAIGDTWGGEPQHQDGRPLGDPTGIRTRKTKNPWDPATGASGSSAGPAAAVAAGLTPVALGTETGGSVISPASTCGVVGLRPSYGRISRQGVMTLRWTLDKVGVLARSVQDCGEALRILHGPDGRDGSVSSAPFRWTPGAGRNRLRLGVVEAELFEAPLNVSDRERTAFASRRPVFEAAVETYRRAGFEIVPIELPPFDASALYAIHNAEAGAMFDDITRSGEIDTLEGQGPSDRSSQLRASRFISAVDYLRAQRVRTLMIEATEALFDRVDVFLAPPSSDSLNITNLTGHPAITFPAGFAKGETGLDMPQNVMLTGRIDDEATILDAALSFERETEWRLRRPKGFD